MTARLWFWLFVCQALWAGSYTAMKFAVGELPVGAVVTLRYGLATLAFLVLTPFFGIPRMERRDWLLVAALGVLNFTIAPSLQVASLRHARAIDVSILVALEPLLTVALAALVLKERPGGRLWGALALGIAGLLVLSGVGAPASDFTRSRLIGNLMFLASLLFEVSVTIAGGRLARRYRALPTMAAMKACGFVASAAVYAGIWPSVDLAAVSLRAWLSIGYLGLLASLFSYSVWYYVIRSAPVHQVALSLFIQPVAGSLLGWLLAGERLGLRALVGGALVGAALAWRQPGDRRL